MRRPLVSWQQVKEPGVGWRKEAFLLQEEDNSSPGLMAPCGLSLEPEIEEYSISSEMCQSWVPGFFRVLVVLF